MVSKLVNSGAEVIHIVADYRGLEINKDKEANFKPRLMKDIIRSIHLKLVEERIRDEITLIFSGGIAMAEHVPKAMLCGGDLTAIDIPLFIALGARLYEEPKSCCFCRRPRKLSVDIITQRIVNLMGAWHSQLLEVMAPWVFAKPDGCAEKPAGPSSLKRLTRKHSAKYLNNNKKMGE